MELNAFFWGTSSSEQIQFLFLHGMGGTGALWRPFAARLEDRYPVWAFDQRGHGGSQDPYLKDFSPQAFGEDVVETLKKHKIQKTLIVAHSMGVRTAVATAIQCPQRVKGLVLIDLGFYGAAGGGLGETLAGCLRGLPSEFEDRTTAKEWLASNSPDPSISQYLMAVSYVDTDKKVRFPFDIEALLRSIEAVKDFSLREWLKKITDEYHIPVLALRGETSPVWTREDYEKEKENFKNSPLLTFEEVQGTGHGLPFEKRQWLIERLEAFMETLN
ncbi:MAG: hypothetical protein CL678_02675 [Bdellovibrionaceae bacterium]|nr:hypothetical protein [Pseudobdellovibrionaceae bacterium]|tara:strand:- start:1267 stop:2085 length:819 start_codon:yes stop_codon:yes gene_type:complete